MSYIVTTRWWYGDRLQYDQDTFNDEREALRHALPYCLSPNDYHGDVHSSVAMCANDEEIDVYEWAGLDRELIFLERRIQLLEDRKELIEITDYGSVAHQNLVQRIADLQKQGASILFDREWVTETSGATMNGAMSGERR